MKKKPRKRSIQNTKSSFNYEAVNEIEVGMVLHGDEVKAIRSGRMQLTGSYGRILQGTKQPELWLVGAQFTTNIAGDKQRSIKLLAHRREIDRLVGLIGQKGYTLVPNRIYFSHGRAKLLLQISKGLKVHEKRAKIRERVVNREIARTLRNKG